MIIILTWFAVGRRTLYKAFVPSERVVSFHHRTWTLEPLLPRLSFEPLLPESLSRARHFGWFSLIFPCTAPMLACWRRECPPVAYRGLQQPVVLHTTGVVPRCNSGLFPLRHLGGFVGPHVSHLPSSAIMIRLRWFEKELRGCNRVFGGSGRVAFHPAVSHTTSRPGDAQEVSYQRIPGTGARQGLVSLLFQERDVRGPHRLQGRGNG